MPAMQVAEIKKRAEPVLRSFGIKRAAVFGSGARGEDRPDSDVDLLIAFGKPTGMIEYMRFLYEMERILQKKVDVVTEKSVNKFVRPHVERDLVTIYEAR